jgi:hypothetical protein
VIDYTFESVANRLTLTLQRQCRHLEFVHSGGRSAAGCILTVDELWQIDGTWGVSLSRQQQVQDFYAFGEIRPLSQIEARETYELVAVGQTGWAQGRRLHLTSNPLIQFEVDLVHQGSFRRVAVRSNDAHPIPSGSNETSTGLFGFNAGAAWDRPRLPSPRAHEPPPPPKIFEGLTPLRDPALPRRRLTLTE